MSSKNWMLGFRAAFLAIIISFAVMGRWGDVLLDIIVFACSLFVPYLGRDDEQYYVLDCFIMSTFIIAVVPSYFGVWPPPTTILKTILGFDKLFHMTAGACLAMFAAITLRKRVTQPWVFYLGLIAVALAVGGAWEVFEWALDLLPEPWRVVSSGYTDTMLDMVADTVGAMLLALVLWKKGYWKK